MQRPGVIAAARALNAAFFFAVATYGLLTYSPFTYEQFIKPDIIPAIRDFVSLSPALFWLVFLITLLTLYPHLQPPSRSRAAVAYVIAWAIVGIWVLWQPVLATLADSPRSLIVALLALAAPVSLVAVDTMILRGPAVAPIDARRAIDAMVGAGLLAWAVYAIAAPARLREAVGIHLTGGELVLAFVGSAVAVLAVFAAASLVALTLMALARLARAGGVGEYVVLLGMLTCALTVVMYALVCASIAFTGGLALLASLTMSAAATAVWAGLGRVRATPAGSLGSVKRDFEIERLDALRLFLAPIAGGAPHNRQTTVASIIALPILAFVLTGAVEHLDWNFLLQKLTVLVVWLAAFAVVYAATRPRRPFADQDDPQERRERERRATASAKERSAKALAERVVMTPATVLIACALVSLALSRAQPVIGRGAGVESVLDRYAVADPSYRLIRDARTVPSGETARFYAYLRANTLVPPRAAQPADVDFVDALHATPGPKPLIFLIVIDSLRRDYVSAYNPAVTFTPQIAKFAADSVVFDRAFARYAGTALAVPSIWSGGMMIHELEPHDFDRRNGLRKLLDADGYHVVLTMDHIVKDLMPQRAGMTELDPALPDIERDMCRTAGEIEPILATRDPRPLFVYTLPQNDHIAVASKKKLGPGESYPGFFAPVASSVRDVDACFGRLVDSLKRAGLYDRSLIVLTSDHGDSLGEGGRWGHGFFLYPEVMRVPLIIHLPASLRGRVSADPNAVAFSTDITPTLYALLGHEPADLGPLFGRPLFGPIDGAARPARRESFLLASSYGAVYGILRDNGRLFYTSDAEDARDFAFDLSADGPGIPLALTADMTAVNRQLIRDQLSALAALNHFVP
jgi:hypothetical protein